MRTEEEIKLELTRSEYLYKLKQNTREYTKHYYQAGYSQALKVVLGLKESELIKEIKTITDFDNLSKLLESEAINENRNK